MMMVPHSMALPSRISQAYFLLFSIRTGIKELRWSKWIVAGWAGEGMVWAWLTGSALGIMIAGREKDELPGGRAVLRLRGCQKNF
jgi:hypothetical protein